MHSEPAAPLACWRSALRAQAGADARGRAFAWRSGDFEFSSRGDRVAGRLWLPAEASAPYPLVLLQHGRHGSKDSPYIEQVGLPWVRGGAALACIDFPLHGSRRNAKLSPLLDAIAQPQASAATRAICADFVEQAVCDLRSALDVLSAQPEIDAQRIAYAGLSLGAIVGAIFCASDPRPGAIALALGGGGFGGEGIDPLPHVARIAPRPLLFVNGEDDTVVPPSAARALHAAAAEPKQVHWFAGGHLDLPGRSMAEIWRFLQPALGL